MSTAKLKKILQFNILHPKGPRRSTPGLQVYDFRRLAVFCFGVTSALGGASGESIRFQGLHRGVGPARRER